MEKGEGFAGTIIKDTWTITGGLETREGGAEGLGGKGRKLYLNNNLKNVKKIRFGAVKSLDFSPPSTSPPPPSLTEDYIPSNVRPGSSSGLTSVYRGGL